MLFIFCLYRFVATKLDIRNEDYGGEICQNIYNLL